MTALEFKLATAMAKDLKTPLPWDLHNILIGCGLKEFEPVAVSLKAVASLLRYQCLCMDGSWDEHEYQNMRWVCVHTKRITISDLTEKDAIEWAGATMGKLLSGE